MAKHTPGPWEQSGCSVYGKTTAKPICLMSGPAMQEEREANARLIASAPELLEACKMALNLYKHSPYTIEDTLRQAIAKAEDNHAKD